MSQPQVIPAPRAQHAHAAAGPTAPEVAAPPGDGFAPALAAAAAGTGPPGRPVDDTATRTAVAEGDQAGSDSSGDKDEAAPETQAGDTQASLVLALAVGAVAPAAVPTPSVDAPPSAETAAAVDSAAAPLQSDAVVTPLPPAPAEQIGLPESKVSGPTAAANSGTAAPIPAAAAESAVDALHPAAEEAAATDDSKGQPDERAQAAAHAAAASPGQKTPAVAAEPQAAPTTTPSSPVHAAAASPGQKTPAVAAEPQTAPTTTPGSPVHAAPAHADAAAASTAASVPTAAGAANTAPPEPAGSHETPIPSPIRLSELAQAARTAISVTARQGGTIARIVLHPEELGTVEIRLSYGADGISATMRAASPQAAQALAQGGGDLRQALAAHGLDLLDLDISDRRSDKGSQSFSSHSNPAEPDDRGAVPDENEVAVDAVRLVRAGSRVDVLA